MILRVIIVILYIYPVNIPKASVQNMNFELLFIYYMSPTLIRCCLTCFILYLYTWFPLVMIMLQRLLPLVKECYNINCYWLLIAAWNLLASWYILSWHWHWQIFVIFEPCIVSITLPSHKLCSFCIHFSDL